MPGHIDRAVVERFYEACAARDLERLMTFFAPDVTWVYRGPPSVLPYCGEHHGKDAVRNCYATLFRFNRLHSFFVRFLVIENDVSAALLETRTSLPSQHRNVVSRVSHFIRWHDGRIAEFRAMLDSLDTVEQILDRELVPVVEDA